MSSAEYVAFIAGVYAFFNPCGVAMLPAYISYYIERKDFERKDEAKNGSGKAKEDSRKSGSTALFARILDGFLMGLVVSLGFLLIFAMIGIIISYVGSVIIKWIPVVSMIIGAALVFFGIMWLLNKEVGWLNMLDTFGSKLKNADMRSRYLSFFIYGIGYGIASISCTLPIFLTLVITSLTTNGILAGSKIFLLYGLGMSSLMILVTMLTAVSKAMMNKYLKAMMPYVRKIGAIVIIVAGAYIIYYQSRAINTFNLF